jgi:hypothetical protein
MERHRGYALEVPRDERARLAAGWLALGLGALVGSGLFAVLLVAARAPFLKELVPAGDFFRVALIAHVDLSVLVWFAAVAGMLWSLNSTTRALGAGWAALWGATAGTLLMIAAPFAEHGLPVMANYIPVIESRWFMTGLVMFAASWAAMVLRSMAAVPKVGARLGGAGALRFGLNASLVSAAVALIAFGWSWAELPATLEPKAYYEVLFWGGGHVLQFTWTLLMLVAWLWLAEAMGARVPLTPRIATLFFGVGLASVFATPVIYLAWDVVSLEHYRYHTWVMRFGGGLAILPFALAVGAALLRASGLRPEQRPLAAALGWSMALFGAGGLIGFAIAGSNVRIPAHYHGCIVGVTLALMGLVYHLLPRLGFAAPAPRAATVQAWLYGAGQLMHVAGLAWSGGYGVQRKVAGAEQALRTLPEIAAMGLMGLGGLVAIAGGLLFLVIVIRAMAPAWNWSLSRS